MGAILGFTGPPDRRLLDRMCAALAHRGRKGRSVHESAAGTIAHLANHDAPVSERIGAGLCVDTPKTRESASGSNRSEAAIAVAGQILNAGDGPVLPAVLQRYLDDGPTFVSGLRGAFVLAVLDGDTVHLARDGAGVRTAYYGRHAGRFLFAIEPKGVLAAPGFPRRIRPSAVAQYLTFSFVPGADTMLEDLHELPPGHVVSGDGHSEPELRRHFFFEDAPPNGHHTDAHWAGRFRDEFGRAVAERLPNGEPVGVFLSGGIDSSVVTAEVARRHDRPVRTYAIHFGKDYPHELDFARAVAERCGTEHEEVLVRPKDFLPRLRRIIWHLDDPIGDPISVPNFELAAHAARDVRWVFNGEGGDPCFGGPKNIPMLMGHWYGGVARANRFRERAYLASYRRCYDELDLLLSPEWRRRIDPERDLESVLTPFFEAEAPAGFLHKLMAINIRLKGAHLILPKVDRMLGAAGLTAQAPLFDERLVRLSFEMPPRLKLFDGVEKRVLKLAYADALPREVIERPKSGMRVPLHFWFQREMKRYARKILSPRNVREVGIFDPDRVRQLLAYDSDAGLRRYGLKLWMLITFEMWRRIVVDGEAP